eukprot:TRINITY_DN50202_c0_g2_i1.p1 TRINITY_DN50202_c0_g2~~TRINITY_DN50202_c0_g2_i1.p1  ORF type:complete len:146 (+),score=25.54 TRINITY_DN50202_c0_g2_i1:54-491(+)
MTSTIAVNGVKDDVSTRSSSSTTTVPITSEFPSETVDRVEELIELLSPTAESDQTRKWIFTFMEKLIKSLPGVLKVFQYGSSAVRTYLPDGDIDIGAFLSPDYGEEFFLNLDAALRAHTQRKELRQIGREVQQECRDRSRMPSSA